MMSDPHQAMQIAWMQTWQMQATQIARMQGRCEAMPVDMGWPHALNFEGEVYEYARTQAMQIAWMQGRCEAMTDDMSWPHAFNVEGEVPDENKRQDGFLDIDIAAELLRLASWGLSSVQKATCLAECLQLQLASVSHTLTYLMNMPAHYHQHPGWDDLELRAARALIEVDTLLRNQTVRTAPPLPPAAVDELKLLQRHAQDIAMMACSRFINQATLQSKGIPTELLSRLQAAFTYSEIQDDNLWSRLGNSKFHVFTQCRQFGERKHRHGRGGRKSRRNPGGAVDDEASTEARDPAASSSAANSSAASSDVVAGGGPAAVVSLSLADLAQPPVPSLAASSWEVWEKAGLLPTPPTHERTEGEPYEGIGRATWKDWATHLEGLESRLDESTEALRIHLLDLLERSTKEATESYYIMKTYRF
jgi:hypothetical protein